MSGSVVSKYERWYLISIDINECSHNNGGCEDIRNNTMGSYKCSCQVIGYSLDNDKHNCSGKWLLLNYSSDCYIIIDINECSDNNGGCSQSCTNTPGSYYSNCGNGYSLDIDGHNCTGIDISNDISCKYYLSDVNECTGYNGGCEHTCINSEGSYSCSCKSGYSLNSNGRNCSGKNMFD